MRDKSIQLSIFFFANFSNDKNMLLMSGVTVETRNLARTGSGSSSQVCRRSRNGSSRIFFSKYSMDLCFFFLGGHKE